MNTIIKNIMRFTPKSSVLIFISIIIACIVLIYDWQNNNWIESTLLVLITSLFFVEKAKTKSTEKHLHDLLDNVSDSIITIDSMGTIQSFNHTAEDMFGYSANELRDQNIKMLMPSPYTEMHDSYLANYKETGIAHIIGQTREVEALRKNGEVFEAELWIHKLVFNGEIQFMGILRDISERKHVNRIKTEFISTVSHELRTPLTSIRGSLGMLKSGVLGEVPEKANRMIELAHNNTERLINLVNDILDVEKIQAGKMELKFTELNMTSLVQQSILENEAYANSCNVKLTIEPDIPDYKVYADQQRLQQVMANLISNAAKFSPDKGVVNIAVEKKNNLIRISVSDNGTGIPEEYRHKIFQKFSQVDSSDTRKKGGTGLGLNITKAIIDHHGGHIDYITGEGKGSTFFFELIEFQQKTEATPAPEAEVIPDFKENVKHNGHILVLEDEQDIANLLSLLLEQQGFLVTTCNNSQTAKELLANTQFDAITVDIRLPGQDGLSFIKEFREQETNTCIPIIIISAEAEYNKNSSSSALRILDWIEKPIDTPRLNKALQKALIKSKKPPTILHVEDNQDLIEMMSGLLENSSKIINAPSLASAKEAIKNTNFDLLILDIGLPDGNGLDLIPLMNQIKPLVPVIIFSAQSVEQNITEQVDSALIKSQVTNEQLIKKIKELISQKGNHHEDA